MANKWREFWVGFPKNPYEDEKIVYTSPTEHRMPRGRDHSGSVHVIEKAALDEALELINALEKTLKDLSNSTGELWPSDIEERTYSPLKKIKAFKDRGSK